MQIDINTLLSLNADNLAQMQDALKACPFISVG